MEITVTEIARLWDRTLRKIEEKVNDRAVFASLFEGSYIDEVKGDTLVIVFNSTLATTLMRTKYADLIKDAISEVSETDYKISCVDAESIKDERKEYVEVKKKSVYFQDTSINANLNFDNFVVGDFNREASQAALLVASNPGRMFNPLFLYSNSGLGKTHLLNAIGNSIISSRNPNAKILYITSHDFVDEYIKYVKDESSSENLRDFFKDADVLLFDDVQFLANKVKTEEFFFLVYNDLINKGKQVVITSDKQPVELKGLEERLVTRFSQGLVVKINEPDTLTSEKIFRKKIEAANLDINKFDENVITFFAEKFSKNVRELEGALNRLILTIVTEKHVDRITLDIANKAVLTLDGGKAFSDQLNEQKIISVVANYYNISVSQLTGKIRTGQIVLARHMAMYLIRDVLDLPLKKIGDAFGGRDHTTVMSAIERVEKELKNNPLLINVVEELKKQINE